MNKEKYEIGFVSTYPPRECGIATFTEDLVNELDKINSLEKIKIIAINDNNNYKYDNKVIFEIEQNNLQSYLEIANKINNSNISLLCIQFEFGIYGGNFGEYIIEFADAIQIPIITTLHTILPNPIPEQQDVIKKLAEKSTKIITMAQNSINLLVNKYSIPIEKIEFIPHGVPFTVLPSRDELKQKHNYNTKKIISTFGLISPGKGIEYAIEAMAQLSNKFDNIIYLILGQTHPAIKREFGESYRNNLKRLVQSLNLEDKVIFVDKYFEKKELLEYLQLSDIYLTPYLGKDQAVSGTLAYAVGYGKAIVSTPYKYAEEMLDNKRGILVNFQDATSLANALEQILSNEDFQKELENKTLKYGSNMMWTNVASAYSQNFVNTIMQ